MSAYVGKLFTAVSSALEFNTATLSGAIDIIVIEDDLGRRFCSPFHVRFGKLQLLKSRGIPVQIDLNGHRTSLQMLLGAAGEAYFYNPNKPSERTIDEIHEAGSSGIIPKIKTPPSLDLPIKSATLPLHASEYLEGRIPETMTSSIISSGEATVVETRATDYPFGYISDSEVELTRHERDGTTEVVDEPRSPPLFTSQRKWTSTVAQNPPAMGGGPGEQEPEVAPDKPQASVESISTLKVAKEGGADMGDGSSSGDEQNSSLFGLPASTSKSVIESNDLLNGTSNIVQSEQEVTVARSMNEIVGEEETKLECRSVDGYDADDDQVDDLRDLQEQVALVLGGEKDRLSLMEEGEDGRWGTGLSKSQEQRENGVIGMSLCGKLVKTGMEEDHIMELFERHLVTYEEFAGNPSLLYDPRLLFRIDDRLVELRVAAPFIFSVLAFNARMDIDELARIVEPQSKEVEAPKSPPTPSRRFRWFGWASPRVEGEPLLQEEDLESLEASKTDMKSEDAKNLTGAIHEEETGQPQKPDGVGGSEKSDDNLLIEKQGKRENNEKEVSVDKLPEDTTPVLQDDLETKLDDVERSPVIMKREPATISFADLDPEALSLRPTAEDLGSLDLKPGANTIRFYVESNAVELNCRIFLWSRHTKIVISDVDGTITRSDVLGHLLPAVGRDWSQVGVAGLYTQIEKNGYKILYLTARPIGQASQTRTFLRSVTQGSAKLPNGPVLMSPNRLVESFTREVIRRKPHEFKIGALREIRSLFPPDYNPFHAGFGNRETDVISYRAVGLIPQRIFVVNPRGELVVMKAKYESAASYSTLQDLVESVFPDISGQDGFAKIKAMTESATFNDWNYWKGSLPTIDLEELLKGR